MDTRAKTRGSQVIAAAIDFAVFLQLAWRAWRAARVHHSHMAFGYATRHGVPALAVFVGVGRSAWRVSQRAIEEFPEDYRGRP